MKAQILKIAGVKSEKEFYKKFPTEEAFLKKHGKQLAKLKKAQIGTMISGDVTAPSNVSPVDFSEIEGNTLSIFSPLKDKALEMGVSAFTTDDEEKAYTDRMMKLQAYQNSGKGGGGNMLSSLMTPENMEMAANLIAGSGKKGKKVMKFEPHMMYDPKTGKAYKANKKADHERMSKLGYTHEKPKKAQGGTQEFAEYVDLGFDIPDEGISSSADPDGVSYVLDDAGKLRRGNKDASDISFGGKLADQLKSAPVVGDIVRGIGKIKQQRENLQQLRQMQAVSNVALSAALSKPEMEERKYVRPEDVENTGEEFFPIYGVGTNVLAKSGAKFQKGGRCWPGYRAVPGKTPYSKGSCVRAQDGMNLFSDPGYVPLYNVNKAKQFQEGGDFPYQMVSDELSSIAFGNKANRDAGTDIGSGIGRAVGTALFGPVGGAVGSFVLGGVGDLLDRSDRKQKQARERIDSNVEEMTLANMAPAVQAGFSSYMKKGGKLPGPNNDYGMIGAPGPQILKTFDGKNLNNMLQKASRMPDTLKKGGKLKDPDIKTVWGGEAKAVSYNPYAGGESIYFEGNSHEKKDPKTGQTGIGVAYGPQSVAMNEAVVEVENEPAQKLKDGGSKESLVVFGDLKIPNDYVAEIGDSNAKGKKFKTYVNELNNEESKVNFDMKKAVEKAGGSDDTPWGEIVRSTSDAIIAGADMKLKAIANKKKILSDVQTALNDTFDEYGIDGNKFINKGEIVKDVKDIEDYAEDGTKVKKLKKIEKELHKASKMHKSQAQRIGKMVKGKDGVDVPKAQGDGQQNTNQDQGLDLNELPEEFATEAEAIEAGYVKQDDGTFVKEVEIQEEVEGVDATGSDIGKMPANQKYDSKTGLAGGVTEADYEKLVTENTWFNWDNFDRRKPEDVKRFQREFNKRNKDAGIDVSLTVDGIIGKETASARFTEAVEAKDPKTKKVFATIGGGDPSTTEEVTEEVPSQRNILTDLIGLGRQLRRRPTNTLDYNQILPEMLAASQNQVDPVYAQTFQPRLRVPYDISFQDERNDINSFQRSLQQNPAVQNNPAALAALQAPAFEAINKVNAAEFRANQEMKDTVYSGNIDTLNQARLTNLGILDQQQTRQAQAVANTKATNLEIAKSISDKYQKNKLENIRERVLENLYPQYGFDAEGRMVNVGPPAYFSIPGVTNPYSNLFDIFTGGGIGGGQVLTTDTTTTEVPAGLYGTKLKRIKRNQKNSNVVRNFKNMTYNDALGG